MLKYIFKRILLFIPTLFMISLLTFFLSTNVPGDPVEQMLNANSETGSSAKAMAAEKAYIDKRHQLGLDLPTFYFSISNQATPKDLFAIPKKYHRENLSKLIKKYGNWKEINAYYNSLKQLEINVGNIPSDTTIADALIDIKSDIQSLQIEAEDNTIKYLYKDMQVKAASSPLLADFSKQINLSNNLYSDVINKETNYKNFIPSIHWYGFNNQYHQWITKFMVGDFGISYQDEKPVKTVIWEAVRWTVLLSFISIFLTYLIAIPLGIVSAANKGNLKDQTISTSLFILYSLPSFWVATLLIMFFGGGDFFNLFPSFGVPQPAENMSFFSKFTNYVWHLTLPVICYTYGGLAFISRQMRGAMVNSLSQDYVRTARAKGLDEDVVLWKHAIKNSLLPIITLFANVFPLAISGSVVLELIFSIPGMGKTAYEALVARNYPIVYTVVMFSAILTLVGYLVADILYAVVDPRISYNNKK
ncbi:MAG TPA: ABC transporter permease subunit [Chitinophagales bacterium]|jgi:peptide/nickel transport system permease protein|nr:ABC transporter permease subunit [Chitinophagales bacterium]HQV76935.1 ABC transporter permease subunit [Chitinophagales bacterium]HQW77998.1 ABC transporter permease subunit [Chitinophagales bacterium]